MKNPLENNLTSNCPIKKTNVTNITAPSLPTGLNQPPSSKIKLEAKNTDNSPVIIFTKKYNVILLFLIKDLLQLQQNRASE